MSRSFLSGAVVRETTRAMIEGALRFYEDLRDMGHIVYGALPPRRTPTISTGSLPRIFLLLEDVVSEELASRGVEVIDHRLWSLDSDGRLRPEFAHPDPADVVHGSDLFGRQLLEQILAAHARRAGG